MQPNEPMNDNNQSPAPGNDQTSPTPADDMQLNTPESQPHMADADSSDADTPVVPGEPTPSSASGYQPAGGVPGGEENVQPNSGTSDNSGAMSSTPVDDNSDEASGSDPASQG